jgi:hypothetical protein
MSEMKRLPPDILQEFQQGNFVVKESGTSTKFLQIRIVECNWKEQWGFGRHHKDRFCTKPYPIT